MKPTLAVIGIVVTIIGTIWIKENMASPAVNTPSHPLAQVFEQYKETNRFEIPDDHGATAEEKKKWALLRDVITCESASRWIIVEVPGVGWDTGPCQVQTKYHIVPAARKGWDLFTPNENMMYCIDLFEQYYPAMTSGVGFSPWDATKTCWQEKQKIRKQMVAHYE